MKNEEGKIIKYCSCGYSSDKGEGDALKERGKSVKDNIEIIEKDDATEALPIVDAECPKCGNGKARFWMIQTRASDEPETKFMRCTKCNYTWRDYK
jgi:DNA-directed RNA polymerase subunit M